MKKFFFNVIKVLCVLHFGGCQNNLPQDIKNVLRINQNTGIESLDPAFAKSLWMMWHANLLYNRLLESNGSKGYKPSLAKSWQISADRKTYTFNLRTDVFFQENEAFGTANKRLMKASDVVYSFNRILDEKINSPGAWIFNGKVDSLHPFVVVNDSTMQINLQQPFTPLLNIISMHYASIVPKEVVEKWGKDFRSHPCGTGPYTFEVWDEGNYVSYKKNNLYWEKDSVGKQLPYMPYIKFSFIDSKASEFLLFMQQKIDFMNSVDASFKDQLLTKQGTLKKEYVAKMNLLKGPYLNVEYLGILLDSTKKDALPLLQNIKVRQAMNCGFDKQKLVTYLRNNIGTPANNGMVPAGLPGFDSAVQKQVLYNPEVAKQLLKGISTKEVLKLYVPDMYEDRCAFIVSQLAEVGIEVKLEIIQQGVLREKISQSGAGLFWATWIADYTDAESYLSMFYGKNSAPPNYTRFNNAAFNILYETALQETNEDQKIVLYKKMDAIIRQQAPAIPLFYDEVVNFTQPNIKGWKTSPVNVPDLKYVWKE